MELHDKVVAITGAGSGIGRATALRLAAKGAHLALSDVSEQGLAETARLLAGRPVRVTSARVDVADRAAVEAWARQVAADHGRVNVIINNAGVVVSATVDALAYDDFAWLMNINFWGVIHGTKAFLPYLRQADEGFIVNVSSVFGMVGVPTQSAYNAAKFAVRGFSESLAQELDIARGRDAAQGNVRCASVHPGGIRTNIVRSARTGELGGYLDDAGQAAELFDRLAMTSAEKAAQAIIRGIEKNKRRILIGPDAHAIDLIQRTMPVLYQKIVAALLRRRRSAT